MAKEECVAPLGENVSTWSVALNQRAYKGDAAAPSNRGKKDESKARYDMETKGLDEAACEKVTLGDTFLTVQDLRTEPIQMS